MAKAVAQESKATTQKTQGEKLSCIHGEHALRSVAPPHHFVPASPAGTSNLFAVLWVMSCPRSFQNQGDTHAAGCAWLLVQCVCESSVCVYGVCVKGGGLTPRPSQPSGGGWDSQSKTETCRTIWSRGSAASGQRTQRPGGLAQRHAMESVSEAG